jgi:hypothetical protein
MSRIRKHRIHMLASEDQKKINLKAPIRNANELRIEQHRHIDTSEVGPSDQTNIKASGHTRIGIRCPDKHGSLATAEVGSDDQKNMDPGHTRIAIRCPDKHGSLGTPEVK